MSPKTKSLESFNESVEKKKPELGGQKLEVKSEINEPVTEFKPEIDAPPRRFSDFAGPAFPEAELLELDSIAGKEVLWRDFEVKPSKFGGEYATALIDVDGKMCCVNLSSRVVIEQLRQYKDKLPFIARLVEKTSKDGRRYKTLE